LISILGLPLQAEAVGLISAISLMLIDSYLYSSGRIDTMLPLEEMKGRSLINEAVRAADGSQDFSRLIGEI
jgi:hypothetical protein